MPMLWGYEKRASFLMSPLRCLLTIFYLWVMVHGAAIIPVLNTHIKHFIQARDIKFWISYSSLLPFDMTTEVFIVITTFLVLFKICQCCRRYFCRTCGNVRRQRKISAKRMVVYFSPYLVIFFACWLTSIYAVIRHMQRIPVGISFQEIDKMLSGLFLVVVFKFLVMSTVIIRCIRCYIFLDQFGREFADELRGGYSLGDYLNLLILS